MKKKKRKPPGSYPLWAAEKGSLNAPGSYRKPIKRTPGALDFQKSFLLCHRIHIALQEEIVKIIFKRKIPSQLGHGQNRLTQLGSRQAHLLSHTKLFGQQSIVEGRQEAFEVSCASSDGFGFPGPLIFTYPSSGSNLASAEPNRGSPWLFINQEECT